MKKRSRALALTVCGLLVCVSVFCQNPDPNTIGKSHWLVGTWKGTYNGKPFYETWRKNNDNSLICFSVEIVNGDTTVRKNSEIKMQNDEIVFADPKIFKAKRMMDNEMVFEMDDNIGQSRIIWLHTKEDHWWVILQYPKVTANYDLVRVPALDRAISRHLPKQ
jgi:hypothetical protein